VVAAQSVVALALLVTARVVAEQEAVAAVDTKADKEVALALDRVVFKPRLLARLSVTAAAVVAENIMQDHLAELMVAVVVEEVRQVVAQQIEVAAVGAAEETVTIKHGSEVLEGVLEL
jgi:hypothetical protein